VRKTKRIMLKRTRPIEHDIEKLETTQRMLQRCMNRLNIVLIGASASLLVPQQ